MIVSTIQKRLTPAIALPLSGLLMLGSLVLVLTHAVTVREMKEVGLPAAVALTSIEKRLSILQEQSEVAELQASIGGGRQEELLHAYVLPDAEDLDRLLAMFDAFFSELQNKKMLLSFSEVTVGQATGGALPISFEADLTEEGLSTLLSLIDLAGMLTISDVLTPEEIAHLIHLTEQENPTAITAVEQWVSVDMFRYAQEPKPYDDQLLKSFSSPEFEHALRDMLAGSRVQEMMQVLTGMRPILVSENLWPLRFLMIDTIEMQRTQPGQVRVKMKMGAYMR